MAPSGPLYGRESELTDLGAALRGAEEGRGALVLLAGEPGIGKTRLATAFTHLAEGRGARVSWGRAWEAGGAPACWPWIEALRPFAAAVAAAVADVDRERIAPLSRLLPELSVGAPPPVPADPAQERFRLFDATTLFLAVAARDRPVVLVLDDLHVADPATLGLLHGVARAVRTLPVVLVGTWRDADARRTPEVGETLVRIAREGRAMSLPRLDRAAVDAWLAAEGRDDAEAVYALTEGNPLFVAEMLRLARDRGAAPDLAGRIPDGVRDVIRARLEVLPPPARHLVDAASVLGRSVDLPLAAALADVPLPDARDLAAVAARADVLVDAQDRTAFSHILLQEGLYQELPAARRAELHARVGRLLAQRDAADERLSLAEAVHHLFAAEPVVPAAEALGWARTAAARAQRRLAFHEAADLLSRALDRLPPGNDADRCDLLLDLATAQGGAGQSTRGRESAVAAAALARRLDDPERLAQAALRCGAVFLVAVVDQVLVGLLEEASAALPATESPLRARLLARLAAALQPAPDPAQPITLARDAIEMARRVSGEPTRLEVLVAATSALAYFADPRERLPLDAELVALADRAGDRVAAMRGHLRLTFDHLEMGDLAGADRAIDAYDRLSYAAGLESMRWRAPMLRAMRALMDGRFADSEALCAQAATLAARVDDHAAQAALSLHTAGRLWAMGRLDSLEAHLPHTFELVGRFADPFFSRSFRVGMLARVGRADDARAELHALVRHDPPLRGRPMVVWLADACLTLGDAAAAPTLIDLLTPLANRQFSWSPLAMVMEGPVQGWVDRLRGLAGRPVRATPAAPRFELVREGELWTVRGATTFRLRDSRGVQILARLVAEPGRPVHVTELLAPAGEAGHVEDAGEALDPRAIASYRRRLEDLREAEREAVAFDDPIRAGRVREEIEALASELARGVGLGGRARKSASTSERARVNVRQRLRDTFSRVEAHDPALARHLRQAVRTGTFCSYEP